MHGSRVAFPLAAIAALAMFVVSESSYRTASSTFDNIGEQGFARLTIQSLWRSLIDAETGERGYLLTGRPEYLKPYEKGRAQAQRSLEWLNAYYGNETLTLQLMNRVTLAARNKLSELSETVKLYDDNKPDAWRTLLLTDIGQEQMDTIRALSEELLAFETGRLEEGRRNIARTLLLNRIGVSAITALCLLAIYLYLRQTSRLMREREEQRHILQAERDQLGVEVVRRTDQLTELARHLQSAREDERMRLARELHDELGALLTAAKLDVARLKSRLGALAPEAAERMQHLNDALNSGIALKRRIIEDLRPSSLSNLGLVAALEILLTEWRDRTGIRVERELAPVRLQPSGELTVYRLVQEALTNVSEHARAALVTVKLAATDGIAKISVCDDGIGFYISAPRVSAHGLLGMGYRLEAEGGRMTLRSAPGEGTVIEAELPERERI